MPEMTAASAASLHQLMVETSSCAQTFLWKKLQRADIGYFMAYGVVRRLRLGLERNDEEDASSKPKIDRGR